MVLQSFNLRRCLIVAFVLAILLFILMLFLPKPVQAGNGPNSGSGQPGTWYRVKRGDTPIPPSRPKRYAAAPLPSTVLSGQIAARSQMEDLSRPVPAVCPPAAATAPMACERLENWTFMISL